VGPGFCPAAGLPAGAVCDEFAVIQRQKSQLRSERKLGRKAEAFAPQKTRCKVSGAGLLTHPYLIWGKKAAGVSGGAALKKFSDDSRR
jgi:hypothetical protein